MSTTANERPATVPVTIEFNVKRVKTEPANNATDVRRILDDALEQKEKLADQLGEGASVSGTVRIGKQKYDL